MSVGAPGPAPVCERCAAPLPSAAARFCPDCGAPVTTAEPAREKRKTVTLLFTDVTGSTALGERLDPEAYRAVMGRYFAVAERAVQRHGGRVEKFVGDAVLAVFGVPEVREDDALRAVRAAHDLVADVAVLAADLTAELGVGLTVRTGVNTGPVVVGADRAGGSFATGDAVNTAARLEQAAGPGEVLLGEATYELVRDAVVVEAIEPVAAKGKAEPLHAVRLLSVDRTAAGRARHLDAALVGRDREVRALDDALDRTVATGRGHVVSVIGAPGIGKSRLVRDFVTRVGERARVLRGRCVSYGQGITYWPLVQVIRDAAGLHGDESPEVTRHALSALLRDGADAEEIVRLLLPLLGSGGELGDADQTAWAAGRFVEELAARTPVVIEVDDVHWAEPTLVELLERVADETRDLPVLLVCQARPELLEQHPTWGRGSVNAVSLGLEPFGPADTRASLEAQLGGQVPDEVARAVAGWSGGNPLFVEEIATHLVDTGRLTRDGTAWRMAGEPATAGVPATVSALLAARLERLPDDERDLLEAVSVVGLELTVAEARHLAPGGHDPLPLLTALARRDLLRRQRGAAGDVWSFRHVLIRDAAYDALPKAERTRLHTRLAEHLQTHAVAAGQAGHEHAAFVFHHRYLAAVYADELAPHDRRTHELADLAANAGHEAIERALEAGHEDAALVMSANVLDLTLAARQRRRLILQIYWPSGFRRDAGELGALLDGLAESLDDPEVPVTDVDRTHLEMLRLALRLDTGDETVLDELIDTSERLERLAEAAGDEDMVVEALRGRQGAYLWRARQGEGALFDPRLDRISRPSERNAIVVARGHAHLLGPSPAQALVEHAAAHRAPSLSRSVGLALDLMEAAGRAAAGQLDPLELVELDRLAHEHTMISAENNFQMLAAAHAWSGDTARAGELITTVADGLVDRGLHGYASTYLLWGALFSLDSGVSPDSVRDRVGLAAEHTAPSDVMSAALLAAARAVLASRSDDHAAAVAWAGEAIETMDLSNQTWNRADVHRWMADVHRAAGDDRTERERLTTAHELYAEKGLVVWERRMAERLGRS